MYGHAGDTRQSVDNQGSFNPFGPKEPAMTASRVDSQPTFNPASRENPADAVCEAPDPADAVCEAPQTSNAVCEAPDTTDAVCVADRANASIAADTSGLACTMPSPASQNVALPEMRISIRTRTAETGTRRDQQVLIALGYDVGPRGADGKMGPRTRGAIRSFRTHNNLPAGDRLDAAARRTMRTQIREIQTLLVQKYPDLTAAFIDGRFGPKTSDAIARLQHDSGLPLTGIVDAATRTRLSEPATPSANTAAAQQALPAAPVVRSHTRAGETALTDLYTERLNLETVYGIYQSKGDTAGMDRTRQQVADVDARIRKAAGH